LISRETIDRIFQEVRIEEVVADFVQLKKAGSSYKGLSPWSQEKTPSFFVSPSKGIFKDFSSGKGGNAVSFLMELESMSYPEALKYIANKYGIEVEETGEDSPPGEEVSLRETLALVNYFAFEQFEYNLWERPEGKQIGLSYFRERQFTDGTIRKFGLGYALDDNHALMKAALEAGHKEEHLLNLGLVKEGNYGKYDFFRGRVIFPIRNVSGRTIAFAGRTLKSDNKVKYLNSPESELYEKSKVLYGLFEGKRAILQKDLCFLVEGYTDVISLHQAGVEYAVASSGTSLTEDQIKLIKRYTKNVSVLYDGDNAGVKAAMRGIDLLLQEGMQVKVVLFPDGHDPDSYARSVTQEALENYLECEAKDFIDFFLQVLLPQDSANDPIQKTAASRRLVESLALIDDQISRSVYVEKCSRQLGIAAQVLHNEINKILRHKQKRRAYDQEDRQDIGPVDVLSTPTRQGPKLPEISESIHEAEIVRVLLAYGNREIEIELEDEKGEGEPIRLALAEYVLHELFTDGITFDSEAFGRIIEAFRSKYEADGSFPEIELFLQDPELNQVVAGLVASPYELSENWAAQHRIFTEDETEDLKRVALDPLMRMKLRRVMAMIRNLEVKLKACDNQEELLLLLNEKVRLNKVKIHLSNFFGSTIL
jgi:DNA primase